MRSPVSWEEPSLAQRVILGWFKPKMLVLIQRTTKASQPISLLETTWHYSKTILYSVG